MRLDHEVEALKLLLADHPVLDAELANQVKNMDLQSRRLQRQLSNHMSAMEMDISSLDIGLKKAECTQALLRN